MVCIVRFALLTFLLFAAAPAFAQSATGSLTASQAQSFVAAIPDMEILADKFRAEGKEGFLESAVRPRPGDTEFKPYTRGLAAMQEKYPDDYDLIGETVSKRGFRNAEEWAAAGDKVMLAYLAVKMEGQQYQTLKAMANVPPEVMTKLPPKMVSQIEQARTVMTVAENTPPADKETARPYVPAIDAWLAREQKKLGLSAQTPAAIDAGAMLKKPAPMPNSPFATRAVKTTP